MKDVAPEQHLRSVFSIGKLLNACYRYGEALQYIDKNLRYT